MLLELHHHQREHVFYLNKSSVFKLNYEHLAMAFTSVCNSIYLTLFWQVYDDQCGKMI